MRKTTVFLSLAALWCLTAAVFAVPYASQITVSDSNFVYGTTTDVTISFMLNEPADQVDVQIIGPSPSSLVNRTITITDAPRGLNSVVWDGLMDSTAPAANGAYTVYVIASNDPGYAVWTNTTPWVTSLTLEWDAFTSTVGLPIGSNTIRGLGFDGSNLVISSTTPRALTVTDANGVFKHTLPLGIVEAFDVNNDGYTTTTWSLDAWLGPYDVASCSNGLYLNAYRGANFPVAKLDLPSSTTNSIAVAMMPGNARALDAVSNGANTILYVNNGTAFPSPATNPVVIYSTDNATTTVLIETVTGVFVNSHMIIGKNGNTGGDGDVVWSSSNSESTKRYVRSGGVWAEDTAFSCYWAVGGDYFVRNGRPHLALLVISYPGTPSGTESVLIVDADTGEELALYNNATDPVVFNDGNGDLTVSGNAIYFGFSQQCKFGKLTIGSGEIGSAQYYAPAGVEVINNPADPNFGLIAVANSYNLPSGNDNASADLNGVYLLNPDMTFVGDSDAAAYAAAMNDPAAPWIPTDGFSPWKMHYNPDDMKLYLGDWGTLGASDAVYVYDFASQATQLLAAGGSNHGRVIAPVVYGSDASRVLIGIDRDLKGTAYYAIYKWDVGTSTSYTGAPSIYVDTNSDPTLGLTNLYSHRDLDIGMVGADPVLFVCNRRWNNAEVQFYAKNMTTGALLWSQTAVALGLASGCYPSGVAVDQPRGLVYFLLDGTRQVVGVNMADGSVATGPFSYGTAGGRAIAVDGAGNVITSNQSDEHVRMWSPPGASTRAFVKADLVTMSSSPTNTAVGDWMIHE